ncbi:PDZ domain-containing protein [Nocardioides sp. TRM66260-LWL]|uniref:YlbL family protein n=1 Tax=Nocardioides sp. TRM66260-LWL TaxID=2874478 RepID=UPI001CC7A7B3|nr:PDZ domain-containing protein [Nocardioides sp. TRM66260-LWL]MBZ5734151.1 PDZ domain-containing protein [Nocardioides sp. TRM66260-LWL]
MNQRTVAALVATPLWLVLLAVVCFAPLPYGTYSPGPTIDVLGQTRGSETVQVSGAKTYRDDGQLRMVTVNVSPVGSKLGLVPLLSAYLDRTRAVYPYDFVHPEDVTAEQDRQEGAVSMVTSQDVAIADALRKLGLPVKPALGVYYVYPDTPADGVLEPRDVIVSVGGKPLTDPQQLVDAVKATPAGKPLSLVIERDGRRRQVSITPQVQDGSPRIGVQPGQLFQYPFQVRVNIDPRIGGPSAGLMFALSIYDTLTPGSLTDGKVIAGTGTLDLDDKVGPIGGIQQKIAGAQRDGAQLFLVPPDNCKEALGAATPRPRLVRADTFDSALSSIRAWTKDPNASLPSCEGAS